MTSWLRQAKHAGLAREIALVLLAKLLLLALLLLWLAPDPARQLAGDNMAARHLLGTGVAAGRQ